MKESNTFHTQTNNYSETLDNELNDKSRVYNKKIKERLSIWLDELRTNGFDLNFELLAQKMTDDYGISTTAQKLRPMFNTMSDREVKLAELAALAHIIQIPIGELCEFPNAPSVVGLHTPWVQPRKKSTSIKEINTLKNPFYHGDFYAYYFHPRRTDKLDRQGDSPVSGTRIDEAFIKIQIENGDPYIILTEQSIRMDFYGEKVLDHFILKGKLYLIDGAQIAYSFITDEEARRTYALMFKYRNFGKDILYYTTAGMMTFTLNEIHQPIFQKMALFRVKQHLDDPVCEDVIRGILSLDTDPIIIEQDILDSAIEQDAYFGQRLALLRQNATLTKPCYQFSEQSIRQSSYPWTLEESTEVILKLKEMSTSPAHEIIHDQEYFRTFIKHYQQKQMKK